MRRRPPGSTLLPYPTHFRSTVRDLGPAILLPGLVNAHLHSGLLRGTAERLPVWDWLTQHINPMHRVLRPHEDRKSTRLNSSHANISYAVFCLKKKKISPKCA